MFQKTVIDKHLKTQDTVELREKWALFKDHFQDPKIQENIRTSKEEQYQEGFFRDLFVAVFGYTLNPAADFNLTTELRNIKDAKKADGGIIIEDQVVGVIELKGMDTTDLGKVEPQAFNYKNNQSGCTYVIISNFQKLRFYVDDSVTFTEFNLFDLNAEEFSVLYLLLSFKNIRGNIPKKIKDESLSQEDVITKKLYKDYSIFKRELFQNLVDLNPQFDQLELFRKTQKLLDRLLFLYFGEDRGLLPPNSVRMILEDWNKLNDLDESVPLYNRFRKYFGYLNTGFKGKNHDVFAYNGGLFKSDEILDNVKIDDQLLYKHSFSLSEYDFASEVDVNILGHIFENSLNEIDEVKAQLNGELIDKSKTKRKKDGVFYTPKYITKYIVENTVGKLCEEKKRELVIIEEEYFTDKRRQQKTLKTLLNKLDEYRAWLLQITILDPACGSGAFLNEALNFLIGEHQYIDELETKLRNVPIIFSYHSESILEHNLFGVDLNEESVEIAKLSLWLRTAEPNRKLNSLSDNIKCGNSLIDDPEIAGEKAFNWEEEFPQVFAKGGFDVVIGNPPYVRRTALPNSIKSYLERLYFSADKQYDLYILFNEKAVQITKPNGHIGFIQPNKFISSDYGRKISNYLVRKTKIISIFDVSLDRVFSEASVYPYIFIFQKRDFDLLTLPEETVNLLNFCEKEGLKGFEDFDVSQRIVELISIKSVQLAEISGQIKRGVPNSLLQTDGLPSNFVSAIKSTDLTMPYILPVVKQKVQYLHYNDQRTREEEFSKRLILLPRTVTTIRAIIKDEVSHVLDRIYYFEIKDNQYLSNYVLGVLNSKITTYYYNHRYGSTKIGGGYIDLKGSQIKSFLVPKATLGAQEIVSDLVDNIIKDTQLFTDATVSFERYLSLKLNGDKFKKLSRWYELTVGEFLNEIRKPSISLINVSKTEETEWMELFDKKANDVKLILGRIEKKQSDIDHYFYKLLQLSDEDIVLIENT